MNSAQEEGSEVARLLARIRLEYESAYLGLAGPASGASRHAFITRKMENVGKLHEELKAIVGENAMELIVQQLSDVPGTNSSFVQ